MSSKCMCHTGEAVYREELCKHLPQHEGKRNVTRRDNAMLVLCYSGAVSSTWVAMGELLSGASYALSGCLFLSQMSLSHGGQTGLYSLYSASIARQRSLRTASVQ